MRPADKERTFEIMEKLGIERVEVAFSGGNDEGGADEIDFYIADGFEQLDMPSDPYWYVRRPNLGLGIEYETQQLIAELYPLLMQPMDDDINFNTNADVEGKVIWILEDQHVELTGEKQVWENFTRVF